MFSVHTLIATSALLLAGLTQATPIVVGSMSRDVANNSPIIEDSLNHRQWLGWDVTKGLTYAQTVAATQAGGQFAGFSIAHNADAQMFVNGLLGIGNTCAIVGYQTCAWGSSAPLREQVLGESYFNFSGGLNDDDLVFFLSDNRVGEEVGLIINHTDYQNLNRDYLSKDNEGWSILTANVSYSGKFANPIGWLLYRTAPTVNAPSNDVPEPASLALLGLGALGLAAQRRR